MTRQPLLAALSVGIIASAFACVFVLHDLHARPERRQGPLHITQPITIPKGWVLISAPPPQITNLTARLGSTTVAGGGGGAEVKVGPSGFCYGVGCHKEEMWSAARTTTTTTGPSALANSTTVSVNATSTAKAKSARSARLDITPPSSGSIDGDLEWAATQSRQVLRSVLEERALWSIENKSNALDANVAAIVTSGRIRAVTAATATIQDTNSLSITTSARPSNPSHPETPPDCSWVRLAVTADEQAYFNAKANEWSLALGQWFRCRGDLYSLYYFSSVDAAARKLPPIDASKYIFDQGYDLPLQAGLRTFIATRPAGCQKCNTIEFLFLQNGHLVFQSVWEGIDPDAPSVTYDEYVPMLHGTAVTRWYVSSSVQTSNTERPALPAYVEGMRGFMKGATP
jgi:hypothetical protein